MKMMGFLPALVLGIAVSGLGSGAVAGEDIRPACQVRLLKVASAALDREFEEKGKDVGMIKEIVYNMNLPGIPRVIFLSRLAADLDQVCIIDVRTTAPADSGSGPCPDYRFSEVRTTCK